MAESNQGLGLVQGSDRGALLLRARPAPRPQAAVTRRRVQIQFYATGARLMGRMDQVSPLFDECALGSGAWSRELGNG